MTLTYSSAARQRNGLSQACAYGDDTQMATNYPLVQITRASTSDRVFLRTSGHSTMGVATGASVQTTNVTIPPDLPRGEYQLVVIANGITSDPVIISHGLGWFQLHPETVFDHTTQRIEAVSRAAGNLDLFVIGFDNAVWSTFWTDQAGWN